jgi:hypothetical protein
VIKFNCGTNIARLMGKAICKICRLLIPSCNGWLAVVIFFEWLQTYNLNAGAGLDVE